MTEIQEKLFSISDNDFADYESKMIPELSRDKFIGVKLKALREFSKLLIRNNSYEEFLGLLPHSFFEEDLLQSLLIREIDSYTTCVKQIDNFLPYINNWVVCDSLRPKVFETNKNRLILKTRSWIESSEIYTRRFGLEILMAYFLDEEYKPQYLDYALEAVCDEYPVRSMQALFFSTALAKQWNDAIVYLERGKLSPWVHNKAIQKACENYLIDSSKKEKLQSMKLKL